MSASTVGFIQGKVADEKDTRAEIRDHNCYAAGYSDGVIDALEDLKDFILDLGQYATRSPEPPKGE